MGHRFSITQGELERMLCDETTEPKALPLSLLEEITDGFSDEQKIGTGGFAVVYKGKLISRTVAVKRMFNTYMYEKEFQREVECLMMVKHKNVVRFLGYCVDTQGSMARHEGKFIMADVQQRLLCFEYLPKGSLQEYITDTSRGLQWRDRYRIITGICQGLHYLHKKNILHLDLKPANILLHDNWVPKITDFGISRCFDQMQSQVITSIGGTPGYLAPESFNHTEVTYRNSYRLDIYSLGVVILEILTGKKGYHDVDKVVQIWSNTLENSETIVQLKQVRVCAEIGIECINSDPEKRPDAQQIIHKLAESMDEYTETDVITSQQDTDSPTKQDKRYASSKPKPTAIQPGSVQLIIKNNTMAPLFEGYTMVMLELTGGDYSSDRPGLDLVVVVDVSRWMTGPMLGQLKTAMRFLLQKLSPMDRLCVITFDRYARELWPLRQITEASQRELRDFISQLTPNGGGTNIMKGLEMGINVLAGREVCVGRVAGIMLVSSGHYKYGDASSVDVGEVPVYSFCFGSAEDNPWILAGLASDSMGGTFSHVVYQDIRGLTMAFSQCLAGLLSVAVQNLELTVAAVRGESSILRVTAGSYRQERQNDGSVTVRFGDLYSTEVRKVIVEITLPTIYRGRSAEILDVTLSYYRSAEMMKFVAPIETVTVRRTNEEFSLEMPAGLLTEEARLYTSQIIMEALSMADCNRLKDARDKLLEALNSSEEQSNSLLRTELQRLMDLFKKQKTYLKQGRHYALSCASSHNRQRFTGKGAHIEVMRLFATPLMDKYLDEAKKFLKKPTTMPLSSVDEDVEEEEVGAITHNVASSEEEMRRLALDAAP